jgi:HK97 family phage prohead protease
MPIPTPHEGEKEEDFIARCMSDSTMVDEYDQDQRAAICYQQWDDHNKGLITLNSFRARARAGVNTAGATLARATISSPVVEDGTRKVRFCFSDESVDRMGDSIKAAGWQTADFLRNPVALWAHDSYSPPIGRASGVGIENHRLMGDIEFAAPETYEFAETIFRLVKAGFVNAVSVGFTAIEYKFVDNKDRPFGIDFLKQELLEISIVPLPANANALIEARRMGINVRLIGEWAERVLDGGGRVTIRKSELAGLRKAAKLGDMVVAKPANPSRLRDAGGMGESDPSAGGAAVGNCGRGADEECGMKDPAECSIHSGVTKGDDEEDEVDEKAVAAVVRREFKALSRGLVAELKAAIRKGEDEPDGDERPDGGEDAKAAHGVHVKTAHFHAKECMRSLKKALDGLDDEGIIDPAEENPEGETGKAVREARAASLRAALAA